MDSAPSSNGEDPFRNSRGRVRKNSSNNRNRWRSASNQLRKNSSNNRNRNRNLNRNRWRNASNQLWKKSSNNRNRWRSASNQVRKNFFNNHPRRSKAAVCQEDRKMYHIPCDRVWDLRCAMVDGAQLEYLADDAKLCAYLRQTAIEDDCAPDDAGHRGAVEKIMRLERCLRQRVKNRR